MSAASFPIHSAPRGDAASQPRLRETAFHPDPHLVGLSFNCKTCGQLIVPPGAVSRITKSADLTEAIWAAQVIGVSPGEASLWTAKQAELKFAGRKRTKRTLHCSICATWLGFQHEMDEEVVSVDEEHHRPFKLFYYHERKFRLQLDDETSWRAIEALLPATATRRQKQNIEHAAAVAAASGGELERHDDPVLMGSRAMVEGPSAARSLRAEEVSRLASTGLVAKDETAHFPPAYHVEHGSSASVRTQWISATRNPALVLMWGLPKASVVGISMVASEALDGGAVTKLPDDASEPARQYFERSLEVLFHRRVSPAAIEPVHFRLIAASPLAPVPRGFPSTPEQLHRMPRAEYPELKIDWNLTPVSYDGATYLWITGAANAVEGKPLTSPAEWFDPLKRQLTAVYARFAGEYDIAFYEMEFEVWQERKVVQNLPSQVKIVALLLRAPADHATALEACKRIHEVKKGGRH